jgi:hypothetical protein
LDEEGALQLPHRRRGRLSGAAEEEYQRQVREFCQFIKAIASRLDFKISSRGWVEKIDLRNLFSPVCEPFSIPIRNMKGWGDINGRADTLHRFAKWNRKGKRCVLLYCGDHDPAGLNISDCLRKNLEEIHGGVGFWFEREEDFIVDRFGLNYDFIEANNLSWIDNLDTGSGRSLADPKHPDYSRPYAQWYREKFGIRKVEANALVVAPEAGRRLCLEAIERHLGSDALDNYHARLSAARAEVRAEIDRLLRSRA